MVFGFEAFRGRCTYALRQPPPVPRVLLLNYRSPAPLTNFQMAPIFSFLISLGSKKKETWYKCLSKAWTSHSHKTRTEVCSSLTHLLQMALPLSSMKERETSCCNETVDRGFGLVFEVTGHDRFVFLLHIMCSCTGNRKLTWLAYRYKKKPVSWNKSVNKIL
jgi:hypothetical protein